MTLSIKKGVRLEWTATVKDSDGNALNLTSYDSIKFTMQKDDGTKIIDEAVASFVTKASGTVTYAFTDADVANAGKFRAYFTLFKGTSPAIRRLSSPSNFFVIEINE